jgi:hypothetical protein
MFIGRRRSKIIANTIGIMRDYERRKNRAHYQHADHAKTDKRERMFAEAPPNQGNAVQLICL